MIILYLGFGIFGIFDSHCLFLTSHMALSIARVLSSAVIPGQPDDTVGNEAVLGT